MAEAYLTQEGGEKSWNVEQAIQHCRLALQVWDEAASGPARYVCLYM